MEEVPKPNQMFIRCPSCLEQMENQTIKLRKARGYFHLYPSDTSLSEYSKPCRWESTIKDANPTAYIDTFYEFKFGELVKNSMFLVKRLEIRYPSTQTTTWHAQRTEATYKGLIIHDNQSQNEKDAVEVIKNWLKVLPEFKDLGKYYFVPTVVYLTYRYNISSVAYLDCTFYDQDCKEFFAVLSVTQTDIVKKNLVESPSRMAEYYRRFVPMFYKYLEDSSNWFKYTLNSDDNWYSQLKAMVRVDDLHLKYLRKLSRHDEFEFTLDDSAIDNDSDWEDCSED